MEFYVVYYFGRRGYLRAGHFLLYQGKKIYKSTDYLVVLESHLFSARYSHYEFRQSTTTIRWGSCMGGTLAMVVHTLGMVGRPRT